MTGNPAWIGVLWFGIQVVWGAILAVSLQARSSALGGTHAVEAYAAVAAGGALLAALTQLVAGFFSDARRARTGHRRETYLAGLALALPALLVFYTTSSLAMLFAAFAALQIGMNLFGGPYQAAVPDHIAPERRGRASAWMSGYQFAGQCAGLLVAALAPNPIAGVALAGILAATFAVTFLHLRGLSPSASPAAPLSIGRALRTLLVSRGLINLGFYTLVGFLFFYVRESLGIAAARQTTGLLFLAFTIAGVPGAILAGRSSDRYDKRLVVSAAAAAIALSLAWLAGATSLAAAFGAAILAGIAWGAFFTADWAIAYVLLPENAMGGAMGVWNLAATIPQIVAPLIAAPILSAIDAQSFGAGPRVTLLVVILELLAGAAWLWRLPALR